ncbi:MAG TPA: IclR family transcriptional regulator [Nocardioides sp.]|jgi:DNA-binding IclR family transcriptional regulator|uniref:IclR family transcriptional regulator n=1 Tax=Nocardioides sp. TaxID=35761 RepID=UPI002C6082EB|nr:IclR family transcriptional regulator [Nocardioides sp.]HTW18413.1 IclR family transcriptional regulator [Nocardioides sp.]
MSVVTAEVPERRELPPSMVERMTLILDAFPSRTARLTLEDVARVTHLPRSTAHRILDQLLKADWLEHSGFGYSLGPRALHLGGVADDNSELRAAAAGHLHSLMIRTGLTVHLAVLDEGRIHYLDKIGARFATSVPSRVGGWAPAHCTALGRAMLAWLSAEEVDERVGTDPRAMTGRTIADLDALHQELNRVRARHGLAVERQECFEDIACVAAAIRAPEGPIGAISLVGDSSTPLERIAPLVLDAARQVSLELYPDLPGRRRRGLRSV